MLKKVVKYSAKWCAPCKTYAPIFDKISEEFKNDLEFEKIDVDDATSEQTNFMNEHNVRSIPTTLLLNESNNLIKKIIGSVSENDLKQIIEEELKSKE